MCYVLLQADETVTLEIFSGLGGAIYNYFRTWGDYVYSKNLHDGLGTTTNHSPLGSPLRAHESVSLDIHVDTGSGLQYGGWSTIDGPRLLSQAISDPRQWTNPDGSSVLANEKYTSYYSFYNADSDAVWDLTTAPLD